MPALSQRSALSDLDGGEPVLMDPAAVDRMVRTFFADGGQPGLVVGVVHRSIPIHAIGLGVAGPRSEPPDLDTVFRIASMTKSFTAAAVLLLRDEGYLRLDDEVSRYVPEVATFRPPTDDGPALTVRHLLTMTAGFPTDDPWGDRQQDLPDPAFAAFLASGVSFAWAPGTTFEYSNLGYALLGRVITAVTGLAYQQVLRGRILDPLGLTATGFSPQDVPPERLARGHLDRDGRWEPVPLAADGAFSPMGGLFSSVRDLARWVGGFTGAYPPRDGADRPEHPVSRAGRREQQHPHCALPPVVSWRSLAEPPSVRSLAYGYGLLVERDVGHGTFVGHGGGYPGFGSHMRWHPASGYGVVVLANATYAPAGRLASAVLDQVLVQGRAVGDRSAPRTARSSPDTGTTAVAEAAPWPTPDGGAVAAATDLARTQVNQLLTTWDDDLAATVFAANVDLDEPLVRRRAAAVRHRERLGPLTPVAGSVTSNSSAQCAWWLAGPGGRLRAEIRLSPQVPPRVQTLTLTAVPHPPAAVVDAADAVIAALGGIPATWPSQVALDAGLDRDHAERQLAVAAAWGGPYRRGEVMAGDGEREATFRLAGGPCPLDLSLGLTPPTGAVNTFRIVPVH